MISLELFTFWFLFIETTILLIHLFRKFPGYFGALLTITSFFFPYFEYEHKTFYIKYFFKAFQFRDINKQFNEALNTCFAFPAISSIISSSIHGSFCLIQKTIQILTDILQMDFIMIDFKLKSSLILFLSFYLLITGLIIYFHGIRFVGSIIIFGFYFIFIIYLAFNGFAPKPNVGLLLGLIGSFLTIQREFFQNFYQK
ncbi:hypothetical protein M0811_09150 [Anaeramoeba ignava]|uniref:Uncharacterized protein n=1 Tax=Anaeramoeba ignava TaxID=1746090 RepID=A0A9Q0LGL1_ANAIG|nr:hypothetical protein M0811_09150 [Anaeramoeba ignava]